MKRLHGGNIYSYTENLIDFSSNINPLGVPEGVAEVICKNALNLYKYPDVECRALRCALSKKENVAYEHIICGNGGAELIFNVVRSVKPEKVLLLAPTFSEYEQALKTVKAEVVYYYLKEEDNFEVDENILNHIDATLDMIFICNPNNPTGMCASALLLEKILNKANENNIFVVVDECFMDFVNDNNNYSVISFISEYKNLMIIKAFTKIYAMAGLRLGYAVSSNTDIIDKMYFNRQPWSVSLLAQAAGVEALNERDYVNKSIEYINTQRKYLLNELKKLDIICFNSFANFILLKSNINLEKELLKHNILIRNCENFKGLNKGFYRIAVKNHKDNEVLIKALRKITEDN